MNILKCVVVDDDQIQRELVKNFIAQHSGLDLIKSFGDPVQARNFLEKTGIDIAFFDIEMPAMSGLELAASLTKEVKVILISSEEKYALDSYNYGVVDYLVKPLSYGRFLQSIEKVLKDFQPKEKQSHDHIFLKVGGVLTKITFDTIFWIEAAVDYIEIYGKEGKILVNTSMREMVDKLPQNQFIRIHRSYIVPIEKISKIDGRVLIVNDKLIPIGKSYREELFNRINKL